MTADLVEWLRVQLDDDERVAREAGAGRWSWSHGYGAMCNDKECPYGQLVSEDDEAATVLMDVHGYDVHEGWEGAEHIARHDPARVLRDVEAKRLLLAEHDDADYPHDPEGGAHGEYSWTPHCTGCGEAEPCTTKRILALPYSDRPGYREEWKP